jgi:hypothetical protein
MTLATDDTQLPPLFAHATRKDWGVGVLAWELGGKRGYLFEDGEERTLASGFYQLMNRVEQPSADQKAVSRRLERVLSGRARSHAHHLTTETNGPTFYDQVAVLRKTYPAGLLDPKWTLEVRGEEAKARSLRHRTALVLEAQEQLSVSVLDGLLADKHYGQLWDRIIGVLNHSELVPKTQLKQPKLVRSEVLRELASAARDLLYAQSSYEQRFDRFVTAMTAYSGEPAHWEMATVLSAITYPTEHVCVHPTVFRRQFKIIGSPGNPPATKPTGAGYMRVLSAARTIAQKLAEQGEVTRDLLDVHDFIRITLKPVAKVRFVAAKPDARSPSTAVDNTETDASEPS